VLSAGLTLARQLHSAELKVVIIDGCARCAKLASQLHCIPINAAAAVTAIAGCCDENSPTVPHGAASSPTASPTVLHGAASSPTASLLS